MSAAITMPFDTLAFVKRLETAGVPSTQAEAQVEMLSDVIKKVEEIRLQELATKGDVRESELRLEAKIESSKSETIKWVAGMFVAQTALIIGAMFAVMRMGPPTMQPTMYQPPAQELRQMAPVPAPSPTLPAPPSAPSR